MTVRAFQTDPSISNDQKDQTWNSTQASLEALRRR